MFDLNTAFHEAGHTIAACHFGRGIHSTFVLPRGSSGMLDRNGRLIKGVAGLTDTVDHFNHQLLEAYTLDKLVGAVPNREQLERAIIEEGVRAIICEYAGPWAEARKRHKSIMSMILARGRNDIKKADRIATWLMRGDNDACNRLLKECEWMVSRFLSELGIWHQIEGVAAVLASDGIIDGEHALLRSIRGRRPLPASFWDIAARAKP